MPDLAEAGPEELTTGLSLCHTLGFLLCSSLGTQRTKSCFNTNRPVRDSGFRMASVCRRTPSFRELCSCGLHHIAAVVPRCSRMRHSLHRRHREAKLSRDPWNTLNVEKGCVQGYFTKWS